MNDSNEIPKPTQFDVPQVIVVDDAVAKCRLKGARSHRASFWTETARIDVELPNRTVKSYFLKASTGDLGMSMIRGEYEGSKTIHKYTPEGIPLPVAWGTYKTDPNRHFYLCEFMDMIEKLPDVGKFSAMLAKLHHDSMVDPDAPQEFGFHVMTHEGSMYQDISWCKTWEEMYTRRFRSFVNQERLSQGPSAELDSLLPPFIEKVIPRLLRPLESHGRSVKPVALHADIWCGNVAINKATGEPAYFDASVFWGHNECKYFLLLLLSFGARTHDFSLDDLGSMATPRYGLSRHWMTEYHKFFPISAPEEDYEDRNLLYAISGHFCASTLYPENKKFRKIAIKDVKRLLEKYPSGYQGE
ncbi:hypothetical protein AK830_g725 [Neonectria ditissima]|uniref:protein-ribulosamine 3-kinase n=1 Tax=Neonectria ditissima TaxID=78410 RepID=A0A0P7BY08_9HYPO|nr:hypothetical protein AK830_g725 [Neonectria ditissima]